MKSSPLRWKETGPYEYSENDVANELQQNQQLTNLKTYLSSKTETLQKLAPKGVDINKVVSVALFEAAKNEKLRECSPSSVYTSLAKAVELNLVAGGALHRANLVPLWNKAKKCHEAHLWIQYTGLIDLARRSGELSNIFARVVYSNEGFLHEFDLEKGDVLQHKPEYDTDAGEARLAYAVCYFKDGSRQLEVMRKDEIEKIRNNSRGGGSSGPWRDYAGEMWKKTVLRRLLKYLPLTAEVKNVVQHDDDVQFNAVEIVEDEANSMVVEQIEDKGEPEESLASSVVKRSKKTTEAPEGLPR